MHEDSSLDRFLSASPYTHPVDIKKLRFIYEAVRAHASIRGVAPCELNVLDVGCGVGGVALPLAALGVRVTAVDADETDADALRSRAERLGLGNIAVVVTDALAYSSPERFDVAVASEVFEHVGEPGRLAAAIARNLVPDALLVVTTPNGYGPWETMNSLRLWPRRWGWLRRLAGRGPRRAAGRDHEQRYTKRRLVAALAGAGMRLDRWSNSDFVFTVSRALRAHRFFGTLDCKLADLVPHWMASGWYMTFRYEQEENSRAV